MTIKVYKDRIELGSYTLTATPTGASFNGSIAVSKLGSAFTVGQGKSYGFKHGHNASLFPGDTGPLYPNLETSNLNNTYRFSFASGAAQNLGQIFSSSQPAPIHEGTPSYGYVNIGATFFSSETHGFTKSAVQFNAFVQRGPSLPSASNPVLISLFNCLRNTTGSVLPGNSFGEYNNLKRFSFSSHSAAEDIGRLKYNFWGSLNSTIILDSINTVSFNSTLHGYNKIVHQPQASTLTKFSFTNSADRALLFNNVNSTNYDRSSTEMPISLNPVMYVFGGKFVGAQLSNNDYGYCVDVKNGTPSHPSGVGFYSKFPFSSEVQLISITSNLLNSQYMSGITGPTAGYWHGGCRDAFDYVYSSTLNNLADVPIITITPISAGAEGGNFKFPFATDVLSAMSVGYLGLAFASTASDTKGYLLNGFRPNSGENERSVYRAPSVPIGPPANNQFLDMHWHPSPGNLDFTLDGNNLKRSTSWFSNWHKLEYPFASDTTIADAPFYKPSVAFSPGNERIRSHVHTHGGTNQY